MSPRALILTGAGRYADPWHDFAETSARIAAVLTEMGIAATIVATSSEALEREPIGAAAPDVVVVNAGGGHPAIADDRADGATGLPTLTALLDPRVPLLAIHAAANTFADILAYRARMGGHWDPAASFHPERGPGVLRAASNHPALGGLRRVIIDDDERYAGLVIDADVTPLLEHDAEGAVHIAAWARQDSRGRVVYDGLGHHGASYDAPDRAALLRREVEWLLRPAAATP